VPHNARFERSLNKGAHLLAAAVRLSTLLGLALLAFLWVGTFLYLNLDRQKSIEAATENGNNMARLFEEHVSRSLKEIDQTMQFIRHSYESNPEDFDLSAWTNNEHLLRELTVQITLIGPDGIMLASNIDRNAKPVDLSDREHFRVHVKATGDELFVSKPVLGRVSGKWTIQLTRRMSKPDGSFGGVIVASIDPYYLSKFFEQIDLGKNGAISLIGTDGIIRARGGILSNELGRSLAGTDAFNFMMSTPKGNRIGPGVSVKGPRLISFRRMKDFPLIVDIAQSEADILADHDRAQAIFLVTAGGLSLVLMFVIGLTIGHELRLIRARAAQSVSERRVLEKSLELEATLQHTSQGIVMIDRERRVRVINPRAIDFLDLHGKATIGTTLPAATDRLLRDAMVGDDPIQPLELVLANDTTVALSSSAMPDDGVLYTLTDITQHKRTEAVLADARDRAEAGARARASFLATMSHEIRTPLNGVIGMVQLLEDCSDEAERATYTDAMRRSAGHLLLIIEDILDVSKLEADRMTFEFVPFEIAETVRTTLGMVESAAAEKKLQLISQIDPALPPRLMGDPGRMRQVILNLVGNAVKFTANGSVSISVDQVTASDGTDAPLLRIRVRDTGIGMASEDLEKLFKDFSQIDGSITRRFGGTGLGLAISRKLVQNMGGEISVESAVGEGSTFTVLLPVCEADPVKPTTARPPAAKPIGADGLSILLAEDSPTNTLVATRLLQKLGHRVTAVVDGVEAIDALAKQSFDVVLMDVMMPRMDGLTATRLIRASGEPYAGIPIIALTAAALSEDRDEAFAAGVNGFTTKPVARDRLRSALEEVMDRADHTSMPLPLAG